MLCLLTAFFAVVYFILWNVYVFLAIIQLYNVIDILPSIIGEYVAAWFIVGVVKIVMCAVQKWKKPGNYHLARNDILLGLVLIAFFSILGKFLLGIATYTFANFTLNCFFASYFLFVHFPSRKCCWNTKPESRIYEILLLILVVIQVGSFIKPMIDTIKIKQPQFFLFFQFFYSLIGTSSAADILAILMGRLEEKSKEFHQIGYEIELREADSSSAVN